MSGYTEMNKLESSRNCLRRIARHDEIQFSKDSIVNVMEKFVKTVQVMDATILIPCRLMDRQVGDSTDIIPAPGKDSTSNQLTLSSSAHGKRGAANSKNVHEFLSSAELYNLYTMLNALKTDLLWTGKDNSEDEENEEYVNAARLTRSASAEPKTESSTETTIFAVSSTVPSSSSTAATAAKGHNRRPSTASVASIASVSNLSDAESDVSNENDSGVESEGNKSDNAGSSISSSENVQTQKAAGMDKATELAKRCRRHLNGLYQCLEQMTEAANYLTARYQSDIGGPA